MLIWKRTSAGACVCFIRMRWKISRTGEATVFEGGGEKKKKSLKHDGVNDATSTGAQAEFKHHLSLLLEVITEPKCSSAAVSTTALSESEENSLF